MPRKLEEFLEDPTSEEKELTRKLYWSITSTLPLDRDQKTRTFAWCARVGVGIVSRAAEPHLPPPVPESASSEKFTKTTRNSNESRRGRALGIRKKTGYAAQAGGGAARVQSDLPSREVLGGRLRPESLTLSGFRALQTSLRDRAERYLGWSPDRVGGVQLRLREG